MLTIENINKINGKHDYECEIMQSGINNNGNLYVFTVLDIGVTGPAKTTNVYLERKSDVDGLYMLAGPKGNYSKNSIGNIKLTIESIKDIDILFNYIKTVC
jgi:hypothetical protein